MEGGIWRESERRIKSKWYGETDATNIYEERNSIFMRENRMEK